MIRLARWSCGAPSCDQAAFGLESPHGLRAIGWEVILTADGIHFLRCPLHYSDDATQLGDGGRLRAAQRQARRLQDAIATEPDRMALRRKKPNFTHWRKT